MIGIAYSALPEGRRARARSAPRQPAVWALAAATLTALGLLALFLRLGAGALPRHAARATDGARVALVEQRLAALPTASAGRRGGRV